MANVEEKETPKRKHPPALFPVSPNKKPALALAPAAPAAVSPLLALPVAPAATEPASAGVASILGVQRILPSAAVKLAAGDIRSFFTPKQS